jgi:hypothetical protein
MGLQSLLHGQRSEAEMKINGGKAYCHVQGLYVICKMYFGLDDWI